MSGARSLPLPAAPRGASQTEAATLIISAQRPACGGGYSPPRAPAPGVPGLGPCPAWRRRSRPPPGISSSTPLIETLLLTPSSPLGSFNQEWQMDSSAFCAKPWRAAMAIFSATYSRTISFQITCEALGIRHLVMLQAKPQRARHVSWQVLVCSPHEALDALAGEIVVTEMHLLDASAVTEDLTKFLGTIISQTVVEELEDLEVFGFPANVHYARDGLRRQVIAGKVDFVVGATLLFVLTGNAYQVAVAEPPPRLAQYSRTSLRLWLGLAPRWRGAPASSRLDWQANRVALMLQGSLFSALFGQVSLVG